MIGECRKRRGTESWGDKNILLMVVLNQIGWFEDELKGDETRNRNVYYVLHSTDTIGSDKWI